MAPRADGRPDDRTLFALYHLGLDASGRYEFRNLHQCARSLGVDATTLEGWLRDAGLDPAAIALVDFNVTAAHVDAQFIDTTEAAAFIARTWEAFVAARAEVQLVSHRYDVDYDAIWGDESSAASGDGDQAGDEQR